ncbi:hypothetical protein [Xenorhabdus doucetiae]|uniref:Uncharacterized protein n=1 Tax=Xenorhabdus doucetiae TaxID=351671 RepID=A0A068R084_9GAMM|nr:hypothetical protein [Xenorhabdus doucetiae]TYO98194.1 hypothetical protein LY16_03340 [Xenorhabdus doucetiae]CDG19505.1 conserved protein of unknown function [Xenorhabdus doucetiae]
MNNYQLPPPILPQAKNNVLDKSQLQGEDIKVKISTSPPVRLLGGETIIVNFTHGDISVSTKKKVDSNFDQYIEVDISSTEIIAQEYQVSYQILAKFDDNTVYSETVTITVVDQASNNKISTSVKSGSDVIIGQYLTLDITLTSDNVISPDANINITTISGIELQRNIPPITLYDGGKRGVVTVELYVDEGGLENSAVQFDIEPNAEAVGFDKVSMLYYAQTVDVSSMQFNVGHDYIKVPTAINIPPNGHYYTKISTTLKNRDGKKSLSGTPVNIIDTRNNFDKVDFYSSDKKEKLQVRRIGAKKGLIINTDSNGRLVFYVYAKQDSAVVLQLFSKISGVTPEIEAKKTLYIIDSEKTDPNYSLDAPIIPEENQGVLRSEGGSTTFSVVIPEYANAQYGDSIFFFINGLMVDQPFPSEPEKLGTPFIQLPYDIFLNPDTPVDFNYSVIKNNADRFVSDSIQVKYVKDETPLNDVFDKCQVYSSAGVDDNNLVTEDKIIDCNIISNYKNNKDDAGLFVKITGTSDSSDTAKVPLGSEVTLYLHIVANKKKLDLPITVTMPSDVGSDNKTNTKIIGIYQTHLAGNGILDANDPGQIYFSYSIKKEGQLINSKVWQGSIDTKPAWIWSDCD